MSYPNFTNKQDHQSILEPAQYIEYIRSRGHFPTFAPPKRVILCYQKSLLDFITNNHSVTPCDGFLKKMLFLNDTKNNVAVMGGFGIGSPVAVIAMEELIAFGVKEFISIGTAGTLHHDVKIGDIILCERAIRDEGSSYHYLPNGKYSYPDESFTKEFSKSLKANAVKFHTGTTWTIDSPYRETVAEAKHYQQEGVLTVEMEAAALFAVAAYRKIPIASAFTISDSLADLKWKPEFHSTETQNGLEKLYQAAIF